MEDLTEQMFEEIVNPESEKKHIYGLTPYEDRAPKPSEALMQERLDDIVEMLVHQKSNKEIKKVIAEKYGISEETVRNNIPAATKLMVERMPDVSEVISKNIETYRRIAESSEGEDKRTAILALQAMEKLMRLHQPEFQTQNNTLNVNIEGIDIEVLTELMKSAK
jgi:predicted transcriptional regulator